MNLEIRQATGRAAGMNRLAPAGKGDLGESSLRSERACSTSHVATSEGADRIRCKTGQTSIKRFVRGAFGIDDKYPGLAVQADHHPRIFISRGLDKTGKTNAATLTGNDRV